MYERNIAIDFFAHVEQNLFPSRRVSAAGVSKSFFYPFFPRKQSKLFCFDLQRHYCVHFAAQKIVFGQVPLKVNQITCFFYQYHLSWQETSKTFFFNML